MQFQNRAGCRRFAGDANDDGVLSKLDITAFSMALIQPVAFAAAHPDVADVVLDMNSDGVFNNLVTASFAAVLGL